MHARKNELRIRCRESGAARRGKFFRRVPSAALAVPVPGSSCRMSRYDAYVQAISAGDWDLFSEMSSDEDSRALLRSANRTRGGVSTVTHFRDMHVYCRDLDSSRVVFHSWKGTLGYDLFAVDQLCARMDNTHGPPDWRRGSDRVHPRECAWRRGTTLSSDQQRWFAESYTTAKEYCCTVVGCNWVALKNMSNGVLDSYTQTVTMDLHQSLWNELCRQHKFVHKAMAERQPGASSEEWPPPGEKVEEFRGSAAASSGGARQRQQQRGGAAAEQLRGSAAAAAAGQRGSGAARQQSRSGSGAAAASSPTGRRGASETAAKKARKDPRSAAPEGSLAVSAAQQRRDYVRSFKTAEAYVAAAAAAAVEEDRPVRKKLLERYRKAHLDPSKKRRQDQEYERRRPQSTKRRQTVHAAKQKFGSKPGSAAAGIRSAAKYRSGPKGFKRAAAKVAERRRAAALRKETRAYNLRNGRMRRQIAEHSAIASKVWEYTQPQVEATYAKFVRTRGWTADP